MRTYENGPLWLLFPKQFFLFSKTAKTVLDSAEGVWLLVSETNCRKQKKENRTVAETENIFFMFPETETEREKTCAQPLKCTVLHPNFKPYQQHARVVVFVSLFFPFLPLFSQIGNRIIRMVGKGGRKCCSQHFGKTFLDRGD
jgi:hypothetical protein